MEYIQSFAEDVLRQTLRTRWALLVASTDWAVLDALRGWLAEKATDHTFELELIELAVDYGIYETWDLLVNVSTAPLLTNWNVDDRKDPDSLRIKQEFLLAHPEIDVLSTPVCVAHTLSTWDDVPKGACAQYFWSYGSDRPLSLSDLVKTDAKSLTIVGAENIPHNSPVWRRTVHATVGYFAQGPWLPPAPSCADYMFWVKAALAHKRFWHLARPLEMYYLRLTSHNRRDASRHKAYLDQMFGVLNQFGLYNNDQFHNWLRINNRTANVLVVHELVPTITQGSDVRLRQLIEWLVHNGHSVTVVGREPHWLQPIIAESHEWHRLLGVRLITDDVRLRGLERQLPALAPFDLAILGVWFWREYKEPFTGVKTTDETIPEAASRLLKAHSPAVKVALLSDDVHWKRCAQIPDACTRGDHIKATERSLYSKADLVLALTPSDMAEMHELAPTAVLQHLPMVIIPKKAVQSALYNWSTTADEALVPAQSSLQPMQPHLLFVGAPHEANVQAVTFLLNECFPLLKQRFPGVKLTMVGGYAWMEMLHKLRQAKPAIYGSAGVVMVQKMDGNWGIVPCVEPDESEGFGWPKLEAEHCGNLRAFDTVLDLQQLMRKANVMIAPVKVAGTGISTKVFLGLENGMHTITTVAGQQGIACERTGPGASGICSLLHVMDSFNPHSLLYEVERALNVVGERARKTAGLSVPGSMSRESWLRGRLVQLLNRI